MGVVSVRFVLEFKMVLTKNDLQQIKEALNIESIVNTSIDDVKKSITTRIDVLNTTLERRLTNVEEILEKERNELAMVKKDINDSKSSMTQTRLDSNWARLVTRTRLDSN